MFVRACRAKAALWPLAAAAALGCGGAGEGHGPGGSKGSAEAPAPATAGASADEELVRCEAAWAAVEARPARPGTPQLGERRAAFLGRARGAMTLLVRAPDRDESEPARRLRARFDKDTAGTRVARLVATSKHDRAALRAAVLREGYLFADEPEDAFEVERQIKLANLFDDARIVLERGEESFVLERRTGKVTEYVHADGPRKGKAATLLFLDRVRTEGEPPKAPLHRDVVAFARREGFDRIRIERLTDDGILASLRYGETWARAVIGSEGARLERTCLREPKEVRDRVAAHLATDAWRRRANASMRQAVTAQLDEALPFDRPRGETGPDKDGSLRPYWSSAYLSGRQSFEVEEQTYQVFLPDGRPQPPQVCVDFVLDTYERAAGGWFAPRGDKPRRIAGRLDMSSYEIDNRRGVLGFGKFASERTDLFETIQFEGADRIPFARRDAFFAFLLENAELFRAGDVLAIQGLKRDDRIHQHAILLEEVDPLSGFPAGLADQMKLPRRRTWEGIMAEAPKRSLLYRARPAEVIVRTMDTEHTDLMARSTQPAP
jgi:hypothetical protein